MDAGTAAADRSHTKQDCIGEIVMLHRCIYVSKVSATIDNDSLRGTLMRIANTSYRKNKIARLSGILLSIDRQFMQILEGDNQTITALLGSIIGDDRHSDMAILEFIPTERRIFPEWSMKVAPVRRSSSTAVEWGSNKITAGAILNLAKTVRAGLRAPGNSQALADMAEEVYID